MSMSSTGNVSRHALQAAMHLHLLSSCLSLSGAGSFVTKVGNQVTSAKGVAAPKWLQDGTHIHW